VVVRAWAVPWASVRDVIWLVAFQVKAVSRPSSSSRVSTLLRVSKVWVTRSPSGRWFWKVRFRYLRFSAKVKRFW